MILSILFYGVCYFKLRFEIFNFMVKIFQFDGLLFNMQTYILFNINNIKYFKYFFSKILLF